MTTKKTNTPATPSSPRVMDIAKPGTLKNSLATARPIIITNRVIVQDPMVNQTAGPTAAPKTEPAQEAVSTSDSDSQLDTELRDIPFDSDADGVIEDNETKPAAQTSKPNAAPATIDPDSVSTEVHQSAEPVELNHIGAEATSSTQDDLDALVDDKTYFLPINAAQHRRSQIVIAIGIVLILVLTLAWLDVALDAGLISISGVHSLTHFFRA